MKKLKQDYKVKCPVCGKSDQVIRIVYGYPSNDLMHKMFYSYFVTMIFISVYDSISFIPTKLDREKKEEAGDDALRQLHNKLLFGAEYGFPIIPFLIFSITSIVFIEDLC